MVMVKQILLFDQKRRMGKFVKKNHVVRPPPIAIWLHLVPVDKLEYNSLESALYVLIFIATKHIVINVVCLNLSIKV